jgi:hypothetical protein
MRQAWQSVLGKAARGLLLIEAALVASLRYAKERASRKESFMFYS